MEDNKRIFSKRVSAYLIDILFVFLVISLISEIKFINPYYDKYISAYENYSNILEDYTNGDINEEEFTNLYNVSYYEVSKYSVSYNIVIIFCIIMYYGVFQKYNNGQTIGKKLMKIKVVDNNTEENISLVNSLIRLIPMYYIYIGGLLPLIINSILVFIGGKNSFMTVSLIVSYIFLIVSIVSFVFILVRKDKRGLHDILSNSKVIYVGK